MIKNHQLYHSAEGEDEFGTYALCADDINMFVVGLDDLLDDGQAQAGPFLVLPAGQIRFVEALPDLVQLLAGDPDPVVLHRDEDLVVFLGCLDCDRRAVLAEFDCIVQEIIEDLLDLAFVRIDIDGSGEEQELDGNMLRRTDALE